MSEPDNDAYDSFIGLVLGTGMNTCYLEDIGNIKTKSVRGSGKMLINTESGNFNRQPRGDIDVMLDQATADAGQNTLEKMISGRYFGELIDRIIRFSEKEVLFSSAFYDVYMAMERLDTISFSEFENGSVKSVLNGMPMTRRDKTILHYIFEMMAKRAAKLITVQIAGISVKCGKGRNGGRPICITVEGSTFYRLKYLKKEVERMLRVWLEKDYGIYTKLIHVENAVLKGAAIAGVLSGS
jgi:hexokinase